MTGELYTVAGKQFTGFVVCWLNELEQRVAVSEPAMLREAAQAADPVERAYYGAAFLMQNIAPQVLGDAGSDEELLLFAVIANYHNARRAQDWQDCSAYVRDAFCYLHETGEREAARRLRQQVWDRATHATDDRAHRVLRIMHRAMGDDPARMAAHDRSLARYSHRALRAASLLDPAGAEDPWRLLPAVG